MVDAPAASDASPLPVEAPSSDDFSRPQLLLLGLGVAAGRAAFSADRTFFNVSPDGPASLGVARWLSGGRWHMFDVSTWNPGYPTLLSPLFWFTSDREILVRAALALNASLAGIAAIILAVISQRLYATQFGRKSPSRTTLWLSAAIALAPASIASSAYVWAESAVTLCFLGTLWFTLTFFDHGSARAGVLAVMSAVVGTTVHARLLPLLAVVCVLTVGRALTARRRRLAIALLSTTVVGFALSSAYTSFVVSRVWNSPGGTNTVGDTIARLRHPAQVFDTAVGQLWYQLAASSCVFGIGAIELLRSSLRRPQDQQSLDARLIIALTAPLLALSMVFTAGRGRPDQSIYGRYNDGVVWPILAIGVAWLLRRSWSRRDLFHTALPAAGITLVLGLFVALRSGQRLRENRGIGAMISGVLPWGGPRPGVDVLPVTLLAVGVFALLLVAGHLRSSVKWLLPVTAGLLLSVGAVRTHDALAVRLNGGADSAAAVVVVDQLVPPGENLGVRFVPDEYRPAVPAAQQLSYALFFQWALPARSFRADFGNDEVGPYVFAPNNDPLFVATGSKILWRDPHSKMVLWYESPPP